MSLSEIQLRFEELSAGRAMGDLTPDEERELMALSGQLGIHPDHAYELMAAAMEVDFINAKAEPMPEALVARLQECARSFETPAPGKVVYPQVSGWGNILRSPFTGWAAAAVILFFVLFDGGKEESAISPAQAEAKLRTEAADLIERQFAGLGEFSTTTGKVVWSDQLQQGFMTLSGIPANDPGKAQYQLWIVDPTRDEAPVDGGVFDIPSDGSPVVVPIVAKLSLKNPQAFVITLEQPGGVVKSKQEKVVALAKS